MYSVVGFDPPSITFGGIIVANVLYRFAHNALVIDDCLGGDLSTQENHAGFGDRFCE